MPDSVRTTAFAVLALLVGLSAGCEEPRPSKQVLMDAGRAHFWQADYVGAVGPFKDALAYNPSDPEVLYLVGQCYSYLGDYREASFWYSRALTSFPGHQPSQRALAEAKAKMAQPSPFVGQPPAVGEEPAATEPAQAGAAAQPAPPPDGAAAVLLQPPDNSQPGQGAAAQIQQQITLARELEAAGDARSAEAAYVQAVNVNPDLAYSRAELGRFYMRVGSNNQAIEQLQLARRLNLAEPGVEADLAKLGAE